MLVSTRYTWRLWTLIRSWGQQRGRFKAKTAVQVHFGLCLIRAIFYPFVPDFVHCYILLYHPAYIMFPTFVSSVKSCLNCFSLKKRRKVRTKRPRPPRHPRRHLWKPLRATTRLSGKERSRNTWPAFPGRCAVLVVLVVCSFIACEYSNRLHALAFFSFFFLLFFLTSISAVFSQALTTVAGQSPACQPTSRRKNQSIDPSFNELMDQ